LRLLVAELEKQRFGKAKTSQSTAQQGNAPRGASDPDGGHESNEVVRVNDASEPKGQLERGGPPASSNADQPFSADKRSRYIPAAIRREVFERDAARCTFVDDAGRRCEETHCLELHHLRAFAQGGEHKAGNLTLRCRAHNALAAEEAFGRDFMVQKRAAGQPQFESE
jgi:hypothetical protein